MRFTSQGLLALSLVLGTQALPKSDVQPRNGFNARSESVTNCDDSFDAGDHEAAKKLWDDSLAGQIADDYINEHGVANWVQGLNEEIFPGLSGNWDCLSDGASCELGSKSCSDYMDAGHGGAYYLFYSLQKVREYFKTLRSALVIDTISQILNVPQIIKDFKMEDSDDNPNVWGIISGGFSVLAGTSPHIAGPAGAAAAFTSIIGSLPDKAASEGDLEAKLSESIEHAFDETNKMIDDVTGAIFGQEGKNQDLIPKEMTKQAWDNTVVNALGDGQWLLKNVNVDWDGSRLEDRMEGMYNNMKQALAWMVIRYGRKGFWFIDTVVDSDKCGDGKSDKPGEFWEDNIGGCVKLMQVSGMTNKIEPVPGDVQDRLWGNGGKYDLDRKQTFYNAYECWVNNDGQIGDIDPKTIHAESSRPQCWYGAHIVRGRYHMPDIVMDEHPGQAEGERWFGKYDGNKLKYAS